MTISFETGLFLLFLLFVSQYSGGAVFPVTANQQTPQNKPIKSLPGNKSIALFDNFKICIPGIVCPNDFPPT